MRSPVIRLLAVAALALSGTAAFAHAFLDHADPPVGRTVPAAPAAVRLWFTERLEMKLSRVLVFDAHDQRVDRNDSHGDANDPTEIAVSLLPLAPGTYKVEWHVVSVDGHMTSGHHSFTVAGP
jgi:methionine-rich copper-binding protein CopC